jgi:ABC-2 type transport system ATP-binding protein
MCDRLFMINKGKRVLYGALGDIRRQYRSHAVIVETDSLLPELPGVIERKAKGRVTELTLDGQTEPQAVLERLVGAGIPIERFEVALPSLDEIFVQVVKKA